MTSAIIVAAGSSRRMGFNKLLAPLAGVPVLRRTLEAFQGCEAIGEIVLVGGDEVFAAVEEWRQGTSLSKVAALVPGGAERHLSVQAGLDALSASAELVAVHDGARPLISRNQIAKCVAQAGECGAVACARPVTETLKRVREDGQITGAMDREGAWIMETPQVFRVSLLRDAYAHVLADGLLVTDEVSAMQHLGHPVWVVANASPNPKITFPSDLTLAERFLY